MVAHIGDVDIGFLLDLANHRIFEGLPRLDEAGQGRIAEAPSLETDVAAQQRGLIFAFTAADQHDHGRIGAGEGGAPAIGIGAVAFMTALAAICRRAAFRTIKMVAMPIH